MKISVVVSTYNRAASLERCLKSVRALANEIIVIDNSSTDTTHAVASRFTSHIFSRPNNLMLNVNKNYGIAKATGDWILYLDDDEEVTPELAKEIVQKIKNSHIVAYWIPRKNIIFGKWIEHGIWWPDRQLRLFRNGVGAFPEKHVHEYLAVSGPTEVLSQPYTHYNYDTISQYLEKMQAIYTNSEVEKQIAAGYRLVWWDALRFPVSDFVKLYFAQDGYKDGLHGLVLALLQSFYSFIVFAKLWEREKFSTMDIPFDDLNQEFVRLHGDIRYWMITTKIRESKNFFVSLWLKFLRRITHV